MRTIKGILQVATVMVLLSTVSYADNNTSEEELQDMSDPMAIYTQAGIGFSNKGLNIKVGQSYDTGNPETMGMYLVEIKGIGGDVIGWDDESVTSNSVDSIRFRYGGVNTTNGRGSQLDINYDFHNEAGAITYSFIQALPPIWGIRFYPFGGLGVAFANNALQDDGTIASGYSVPGTLAVVGMYSKYNITDQIWINYNPLWAGALSGSDVYKDYGFAGDSSVFTHELALSYQITPRLNTRYYANWREKIDFSDGDHRIEFNYQF